MSNFKFLSEEQEGRDTDENLMREISYQLKRIADKLRVQK